MIDRRGFGRVLGLTTGAATVSLTGLPGAQPAAAAPRETAPRDPAAGVHTGFPRLKRIRAGLLDVGYAELGPAHGPAVVCLHGWPYDIHSYVDVARSWPSRATA